MNYLKLIDIEAYRIAFHLSNYVWNIVYRDWDFFAKKTIGTQMVNAIDSVSANIAEGFGRHFKKDKVNFYRYSKGSLKESYDWNEKPKIRNLITPEQYDYIFNELENTQSIKCFNKIYKRKVGSITIYQFSHITI